MGGPGTSPFGARGKSSVRYGTRLGDLIFFLLLLAVSNYGSGSHIHLFWQKSPVELITIGSVC